MESPFELFPAEVWEMILNYVDDSKDIINVTRGISALDIHWTPAEKVDAENNHRSPKRFWYIDQILPLIQGRIDIKDVRNLQLVCRQWRKRLDHFFLTEFFADAAEESDDYREALEEDEGSEMDNGEVSEMESDKSWETLEEYSERESDEDEALNDSEADKEEDNFDLGDTDETDSDKDGDDSVDDDEYEGDIDEDSSDDSSGDNNEDGENDDDE